MTEPTVNSLTMSSAISVALVESGIGFADSELVDCPPGIDAVPWWERTMEELDIWGAATRP